MELTNRARKFGLGEPKWESRVVVGPDVSQYKTGARRRMRCRRHINRSGKVVDSFIYFRDRNSLFDPG